MYDDCLINTTRSQPPIHTTPVGKQLLVGIGRSFRKRKKRTKETEHAVPKRNNNINNNNPTQTQLLDDHYALEQYEYHSIATHRRRLKEKRILEYMRSIDQRRGSITGLLLSLLLLVVMSAQPTDSLLPMASSIRKPTASSPALLSTGHLHANGNDYRSISVDTDGSPRLHASSSSALLLKPNDQDGRIRYDEQKSTGTKILELAVPALGALLIDPLLTLADTAFVGRFSTSANELAGMGSAAALLTFSLYLFNFLCTATTPLVASKRGAGQEEQARAVGGQALSFAIALGATLTTTLLVFQAPLLEVMGTGVSGAEANAYAIDFLSVRAFAAPAVFIISASTGILRGYLDTKTPIYILALANIVNLALDIVLIAHLGMGPAGAGIATTAAEWISALLFLAVLAGKLPSASGELGRKQKPDENGKIVSTSAAAAATAASETQQVAIVPSLAIPAYADVKPLLVASSSVFLRSLCLQLSLSAAAAFAARGGETLPGGASASIAAHQIGIQLWLLCSFAADALAAASQGLVADALGRDDLDDARDVSTTVFLYSSVFGVILAAMLQLGYSTGFLLSLFTSDAGTQTALASILGLIILAQPLNSLVFAADGVLQGASEFTFQAKSVAFSSAGAAVTFFLLQQAGSSDTLIHVWEALIMLQVLRGLTALVKIVDQDGPIRLTVFK